MRPRRYLVYITYKRKFCFLLHIQQNFRPWTYYKWTNNGSLSLISSWPPPTDMPENVHLDEHIHVSWQCWLRNHESSLTKGPIKSLRIRSAISGYVPWLRASWWGAANPKLWKCVWYKIDYYRSGHLWTCIWPYLKVRDTCPLLPLHLIILEYVSDQFKTEVVNHDNAAKVTCLSCKLHIFPYKNSTRNNFQSYRTTAHTLSIISAIYFLLRMHFVDSSRNCYGSFLAKWRRSWWDQSWEACLECYCDTFDTDRCMN